MDAPAAQTPLIQTVRPPLPPDIIDRGRLLDRAGTFARAGLTLVVAPAGYGKTTLLSGWFGRAPVPAAWLSLDPVDRDLGALLPTLVAALRAAAPGAAESTLASLRAGGDAANLARQLASDIHAIASPVVLFLDDWHEVASEASDAWLAGLLRWLPANLHLVVASRTVPGARLARPRALGLVHDLGPGDLRFDPAEASEFLHGHGLSGDDRRIWRITEGWPVALRLWTMAGGGGGGGAPAGPQLRDYLFDEVLARQPSQDQASIRRLAIPDRVDPAIAAALCDLPEHAARALIERLAGSDRLLTPLADGAFRFHALVRDALLDRLAAAEGDEGVARLHRVAASVLETRDDVAPAIAHLLAAGDPAAAAALVERRVVGALDAFRMRELDAWLRALPPDAVEASPMLLLAFACSARYLDRERDAAAAIRRLERLLAPEDAPVPPERRAWFAAAAAVLAFNLDGPRAEPGRALAEMERAIRFFAASGDVHFRVLAIPIMCVALFALGRASEAVSLAGAIRASLEDPDPDRRLLAFLDKWSALMHLLTGQPDRAIAIARPALAAAIAASDHPEATSLRILIGSAHLSCLEFEPAERMLRAAFAARSSVDVDSEEELHYCLALVLQATGRAREAAEVIESFIASYEGIIAPETIADAFSFRTRLALLEGDLPAASRWFARAPEVAVSRTRSLTELAGVTAAHLALIAGAEREASAARERLAAIAGDCEALDGIYHATRCRLLLAIAAKRARQHHDAARHLRRALALAEPHGVLAPFAEFRAELGRSLAAAGPAGARVAAAVAAATGNASHASHASHDPAAAGDLLTIRERQVLDGLREGLTNKQIGERLTISPYTVTRHAGGIFRKLGVSSRAAAIDEASRRGIAPLRAAATGTAAPAPAPAGSVGGNPARRPPV